MKIFYSSKFSREYKKLSKKIRSLAEQRERIFRNNPFDARLKTHRLSGKLKKFLSFSVDHKYRIVFSRAGKDTIRFHSIGTHRVYHNR